MVLSQVIQHVEEIACVVKSCWDGLCGDACAHRTFINSGAVAAAANFKLGKAPGECVGRKPSRSTWGGKKDKKTE